MIYRDRGMRIWMVKFKKGGKVIRRSTGTSSKQVARRIEAKIRASLALDQWGILDPRPKTTLEEFLTTSYLPFVTSKFSGVKTLKYYEYGSSLLCKSELAHLKLDEITDQHAAQFASRNAHFSPSTINCALRTLRRSLNLAEEWGKMNRSPKIRLARGENQRERVLSEEEIRRYLEKCRQPLKDVALIMLNTGFRPDEVFSLRRDQLSFEGKGTIRVIEGKSRAARRMLPMVPEVRRVLEERLHLQQSDWVFPSASKAGHFNQGSAKKQHAKALKDSGVKPFEPYILRHTALTNLGRYFDAYTLARIAGHSSIIMTSRYIHPQADAIETGFDRMLSEGSVRVVSEPKEIPKFP